MRWFSTVVIALAIVVVAIVVVVAGMSWAAGPPGSFESAVMKHVKYWRVGGKNISNPTPDTPETVKEGAEHFQHHCQICHGLDGQNSGVPIAQRTSPPIADLASSRVQK